MEQVASENQLKAIESFTDWSKWLITIDFTAATGCTIMLKLGVKEQVHPLLIGAVFSFVLSVICASFFVLILARTVERVPIQRGVNNAFKWFVGLQYGLFVAGLILVFLWIVQLDPKKAPPAKSVEKQETALSKAKNCYSGITSIKFYPSN